MFKINKKLKKLNNFWNILGPGLITGASDDDPSGIATYSQAGAQFGLSTLWTALICLPLMTSIQEMCARIGLVTGKGLTKVIKLHYPRWVIIIIILVSIPAIILNIAADLAGMGAVLNMIFPMIPNFVFTIFAALVIILCLIKLKYRNVEKTLKWIGMVLLLYFIIPFMVKQDWGMILVSAIRPKILFNKDFLTIIVAILGTTISPYLFFWQASLEVENYRSRNAQEMSLNSVREISNLEIKNMRKDNLIGMLFSQLAMFFIILTTGTVLFPNGITNINTVQDAALALKPLAGDFAYSLFALGVIGTGFLAIPVLSGACGYIITEIFDWKEGLNNNFTQAKGFYGVITLSILVALLINFIGVDPIKALILSAVIYGLTAPILIGFIIHIASRKDIMGRWKSGWKSNTLGIIGFLFMTITALLLIYTSFF